MRNKVDGFTLLEILIVISIIALIGSVFYFSPINERFYLEDDIKKIVSGVDQATDQAIISGKLHRMSFLLGQESSFKIASAKDRETLISEDLSSIDSGSFFKGDTVKLRFKLILLVDKLEKEIKEREDGSLYFLPNGERPFSLLILVGTKEMVTMEIEPYIREIKESYIDLSTVIREDSMRTIDEQIMEHAKEVAKKWQQA